jgi:biotin transport system substrate-specific component
MSQHPTTAVSQPQSRLVSKTLIQTIGISLFVLLTAIGAQLEIQRYPVPYTLQTWFVLMAGVFLGKRNGAISMSFYLLLGIMGVPVFSQWGFGLTKILGPTGGYLLSFPIAAFVVGYLIENRNSFLWLMVSMVAGIMIIYLMGTLHLYLVYFHNWSDSIAQGLLIFSWWD